MGDHLYYSSIETLGANAAKPTSSSNFTTPADSYHFEDKYSDTTNYWYITPKTTFGYWGSMSEHGIAENKFYYATNSCYNFAHKYSAPLLKKFIRDTNWGRCQAPYNYYAMGHNYAGYGAKIYWDASNNRIQIDVLDSLGDKDTSNSFSMSGYGAFILIGGAGGGGGGGDIQAWFQGSPGGGGGGGGGSALLYFDAKAANRYSSGSYLLISTGEGGTGGSGGSGFTAGTAGGNTSAKYCTSSGTIMYSVTCYGGAGGAGHAWDAAADSAGGDGGTVSYGPSQSQWVSTTSIIKLLGSVSGGTGGTGRRGSDGDAGSTISSGTWTMPFSETWNKTNSFSSGNTTCYIGQGGDNNGVGGGAGGSAVGYKHSDYPVSPSGCGMGGYGGGENQSGSSGENGFCGIFYNCIPGETSDCPAKTV